LNGKTRVSHYENFSKQASTRAWDQYRKLVLNAKGRRVTA
jgi:hypothetical protein